MLKLLSRGLESIHKTFNFYQIHVLVVTGAMDQQRRLELMRMRYGRPPAVLGNILVRGFANMMRRCKELLVSRRLVAEPSDEIRHWNSGVGDLIGICVKQDVH